MLHWQSFRVTRPGEPADNEAWAEYTPRGQVWITRLGSHTRVVLVAHDAEGTDGQPEAVPAISTHRWA